MGCGSDNGGNPDAGDDGGADGANPDGAVPPSGDGGGTDSGSDGGTSAGPSISFVHAAPSLVSSGPIALCVGGVATAGSAPIFQGAPLPATGLPFGGGGGANVSSLPNTVFAQFDLVIYGIPAANLGTSPQCGTLMAQSDGGGPTGTVKLGTVTKGTLMPGKAYFIVFTDGPTTTTVEVPTYVSDAGTTGIQFMHLASGLASVPVAGGIYNGTTIADGGPDGAPGLPPLNAYFGGAPDASYAYPTLPEAGTKLAPAPVEATGLNGTDNWSVILWGGAVSPLYPDAGSAPALPPITYPVIRAASTGVNEAGAPIADNTYVKSQATYTFIAIGDPSPANYTDAGPDGSIVPNPAKPFLRLIALPNVPKF